MNWFPLACSQIATSMHKLLRRKIEKEQTEWKELKREENMEKLGIEMEGGDNSRSRLGHD